MINLLILYYLDKKVLTMYGISKNIKNNLSVLTLPSIGTIKPALDKLIKLNCITSQKIMSKGGRPSVYYSVTSKGRETLIEYMLEPLPENPIQFLTNARVRLYCADVLDSENLFNMLKILKLKSDIIMTDTAKLLKENEKDFFKKMVLDNLNCECKNFLSLIEGVERACKH